MLEEDDNGDDSDEEDEISYERHAKYIEIALPISTAQRYWKEVIVSVYDLWPAAAESLEPSHNRRKNSEGSDR